MRKFILKKTWILFSIFFITTTYLFAYSIPITAFNEMPGNNIQIGANGETIIPPAKSTESSIIGIPTGKVYAPEYTGNQGNQENSSDSSNAQASGESDKQSDSSSGSAASTLQKESSADTSTNKNTDSSGAGTQSATSAESATTGSAASSETSNGSSSEQKGTAETDGSTGSPENSGSAASSDSSASNLTQQGTGTAAGTETKTTSETTVESGTTAETETPVVPEISEAELRAQAEEKRAQEAEKRAQEAENAAAEAMKTYVEESAVLKNLENQLESTDKKLKEDMTIQGDDTSYYFYQGVDQLKNDFDEKKSIEQKIEDQKRKVETAKTTVEEKAAGMKDAYGQLAETYNEAGDPVELSTGKFIAQYEDFAAIDFITNFKIKRTLNHDSVTESFGTGWSCPLDSRIVLCDTIDYSNYVYEISNILNELHNEKINLMQYKAEYPEIKNNDIESSIDYLTNTEKLYDYYYSYYSKFISQHELCKEYNSKVRYGEFESFSSVAGNKNMLIFLDEEGRKRTFAYSSKGYWESLDSFSKGKIKIYGMKADGKISSTENHDGGYIVKFENGNSCEFSNYGLKQKFVDRNENEICYNYSSSGSTRIASVSLPTGEVLKITRNQNELITSIEGSYSGKASYTYSGKRLTSVTDNNGVRLTYNYDSDGDIIRIGKADNTCIQLSYSRDSKNRKVCSAVTDENGKKETFSFQPSVNRVNHITSSGKQEEYSYDQLGNTIRKRNAAGLVTEISCDSRGRISSITQMGNTKTFTYDSHDRIITAANSKGGTDYYAYNEFGDLASHRDSDGFLRTFDYDLKGNIKSIYFAGNLMQSLTYNSAGLVTELSEGKCTYTYLYNRYGQLIQKIKKADSRTILQENWSYDDKGRIKEYHNSYNDKVNCSYTSNTSTENYDGRKVIERSYDARKRGYKIVYKDLINKTQYEKSYIYDGVGNIVSVYIGGVLFTQYEYTPDRKIQSYTVWNNCTKNALYKTSRQGIKTSYSYDSGNYLISCKKEIVQADTESGKIEIISRKDASLQNYNYKWATNALTVQAMPAGSLVPDTFYYDSFGRLIRIVKADGYSKNYSYSRAGRILNINDSNGEDYNYDYKSDGSCIVKRRNKSGSIASFEYNNSNQIQQITNFQGLKTEFLYDSVGNVLTEKNENSIVKFSYDKKSRIILREERNGKNQLINTTTWNYNDSAHSVVEKTSGKNQIQRFYDELDREVKIVDVNGITALSYDQLGNIVKRIFPDGTWTEYEYTPAGSLSYCKKSNGEELIQKYDLENNCVEQIWNGQTIFTGDYGERNRLELSKNSLAAVTKYSYSKNNVLTDQINYDTGSFKYKLGTSEFSVTDASGYMYTKTVGQYGKITALKDIYGNKESYAYDELGNLISKKSFGDLKKSISYSANGECIKVTYSTGEKVDLQKNENGQFTNVINDDYDLEYTYNSVGLLSREFNKNFSFAVDYKYDSTGRVISKKSEEFEFKYTYDSKGNVSEIIEAFSNSGIKFTYDDRNREIKRVYSNGNVVETGYTENLKTSVVVKNKNNLIIHSDFVLYDANSRVSLLLNEKGEIRSFFYDNSGRLISSEYSYSDEIKQFALNEAVQCGMFIKNQDPELSVRYLSSKDKNALSQLINQSSVKGKITVPSSQKVWKEEYTYNSTGALKSIKNPYGTITFEYDYLNRVIRKYSTGQKNSGTYYDWDKEGNLIQIKSRNKLIKFSYNEMNQLKTFSEEDLNSSGYNFVEYLYDGLGRKRGEIINGKQQMEYVYDGLSRSVLCKIPVSVNKVSLEKYSFYANNRGSQNVVNSEQSSSGSRNMVGIQNGDNSDGYLMSYESNGESDFRTFDFTQVDAYDPYRQSQYEADSVDGALRSGEQTGSETESISGSSTEFVSLESKRDYRTAIYLNAFQNECVVIYKDSGTDYGLSLSGYSGYEINYFVHDFFKNVTKVCDSKDVIAYNQYDVWGNSICGDKSKCFSGKSDINISDFSVYDFGTRLYLPEIKSFMSMDKARMDGNWYSYCPADPVNYTDEEGFYKKKSTKEQDAEYTAEISEFILFDGTTQKSEGSDKGIPLPYDCADTTAAIDQQCAEAAGMSDYSPMADDFEKSYVSENPEKASQTTSSADYWNGDGTKTTKVSDCMKDLTNPELTTPGTIIVTAPDPENGVSTGHTITILARDYDDDGNIKGIVYIEGHMGNEKPAETGYMYVNNDCNSYLDTYNIKNWKGIYSGTYELESGEWSEEPKVTCGK